MIRLPRYMSLSVCMMYLVVGSLFQGCGSTSSDDSTSTEPADPRRVVLTDIAGLGTDIYNANFVGKTCGTQDKTTTCPNGGTVKISGSFSCTTTNGTQSSNLDLTYVMTNCVEVRNGMTVTLTGTMKHTGSSTNVSSVVTSETIEYKSVGPVKITGTSVSANVYKDFSNDACEYTVNSRLTEVGGTSKVTGTLCGDAFSLSE